MRRLVAMAAVVCFAVVVASAQAASHRLTLVATGTPVLYGHQVTIAGHFTDGHAGERVTIVARPYGAAAATPVATVVTRVGGSYRYFAHPTIQTSYTAQLGSMRSRTVTIGVRPLINASQLGNGQIRTTVLAGRSFRGRLVKLQQQQADASWKTIVQRALGSGSTVVFGPTLASSYLRVVMSVNEAGKGYLGSSSHAFLYHSYQLTLQPSNPSVVYGKSVKLAGHLVSGKAGQPIDVYAKPYGQSTAVHLATATTTAGGWWKLTVSPRIMTRYHATWTGTEQSASVVVGVRPVLTIREQSNGGIRVHVQAGSKSFRGRQIRLQRLTGGGWQTVAHVPLDASGTAIFASGPSARLRVVLSVNEAGKGYLGGYSRVLNYRAK